MRKNHKPYSEFIHKYDERLNLIYRMWEAQIKSQAASKSKSLLARFFPTKKIVFTAILTTSTCFTLVMLYGLRTANTLQRNHQIGVAKNSVSSNDAKLKKIAYELDSQIDTDASLFCTIGKNVYQLRQEVVQGFIWPDEPESFTLLPGAVSVMRAERGTQTPNAYLRLDPNSGLLLDYTDENDLESNNRLSANETKQALPNLSTQRYSDKIAIADVGRAIEQDKVISLYQEFSECMRFSNNIQSKPNDNI